MPEVEPMPTNAPMLMVHQQRKPLVHRQIYHLPEPMGFDQLEVAMPLLLLGPTIAAVMLS